MASPVSSVACRQGGALFRLNVGELFLALLAIADVGCIPIAGPSVEDASHEERLEDMFSSLQCNLGAVVAIARNVEVAVVNEDFTIEPQYRVEGEKFVDTVLRNLYQAFCRSSIVLHTADVARHFFYRANAL